VVVPKLTGPAAKSPSNFPRVDNDTQKSRDTDRRRILEDELKVQEAKLADLQKSFNNGEPERQGDERNYQRYLDRVQQMKDDIARTQSDIDSIRSELSKL
jgi:chromosome segregation ATPase